MNHALTSEDLEVLNQYPHTLKRYLTYRPEEVIAEFIIDGDGLLDSENQSIYAFNVRESSTDTFIQPINCLIKIGTTAGAQDVGIFRVRKNPAVTSGEGIIYVNETAYADVPIMDGMFGTMIRDHRIWERKIRRVLTGDVDFIEYLDYDIAYGGENELFYPPIANVTKNSSGDPVEYMGFLDQGETYRELDLSAIFSSDPKAHFELAFTWTSLDSFSFVSGYDANDVAIKIRIPAGFTEIKLAVQNENGFAIRFIPLWAFTGPDDPLLITDFDVTADQRIEGRNMSFAVRDSTSINVPEGCLMGYFEVADFGGTEAPNQYIDQFIGWVIQDKISIPLYRNMWSIDVGGHQTWLDSINIGAQTVYDPRTQANPTASATRFIELPNATPDKMIHYFLRMNTTALEVMNLYFSDYDEPIEGYTSSEGSVWSQLVDIGERASELVASDSTGAIFLNTHFDYWDIDDIESVIPVIQLDKAYWTDREAPEFAEDKIEKVGLVDMYGSNYTVQFTPSYVDSSHIYHVLAPGIVRGKGKGTESPSSRFLKDGASAEAQLIEMSGRYLARKNNSRPDISLVLKGNYDIIEPAWGEPISITHDDPNSRNMTLDGALFLVKSVSVAHNNKTPPYKKITWNIEQATGGTPGISLGIVSLPVEPRTDTNPYPTEGGNIPPEIPGLFPAKILLFSTAHPLVAVATSYSIDHDAMTITFTWEERSGNLAALGATRTISKYANPFHYLQYNLLTPEGIIAANSLDNPTPVYTLKQSSADAFDGNVGHAVFGSHMVEGWGIALCGKTGLTITFDGWDNIVQSGIGYGGTPIYGGNTHNGGVGNVTVWLCGHDANHLYGGVMIGDSGSPGGGQVFTVYKSTDGGVTWDLIVPATSAFNIEDNGHQSNRAQWSTSIPYKKPGGAPNLDDGSLFIEFVISHFSSAGNFIGGARVRSTDGMINSAYQSTQPATPYASRPVNGIAYYTHDANYNRVATASGYMYNNVVSTSDDGDNYHVPASPGLANNPIVEGWVNPQIVFEFDNVGSPEPFRMSLDEGETWYTCNMPTSLGWASDEPCIGEGALFSVENMPQ